MFIIAMFYVFLFGGLDWVLTSLLQYTPLWPTACWKLSWSSPKCSMQPPFWMADPEMVRPMVRPWTGCFRFNRGSFE